MKSIDYDFEWLFGRPLSRFGTVDMTTSGATIGNEGGVMVTICCQSDHICKELQLQHFISSALNIASIIYPQG